MWQSSAFYDRRSKKACVSYKTNDFNKKWAN